MMCDHFHECWIRVDNLCLQYSLSYTSLQKLNIIYFYRKSIIRICELAGLPKLMVMQTAWCDNGKVATPNNVSCCSFMEVIYIKPVKTTPMTFLPIVNCTLILTCMNLHPCCSHTISSPCPFLCLVQSLVADLQMTGDPHTDLEPGQLGHSNFFLSLVEATVASNLMHSPSADLSMRD